jgi:hypothetical protein
MALSDPARPAVGALSLRPEDAHRNEPGHHGTGHSGGVTRDETGRAPATTSRCGGRFAVSGRADAERVLAEYGATTAARDEIVLAAIGAGVSKHRVHVLTGIARTTVDRIVDSARHE